MKKQRTLHIKPVLDGDYEGSRLIGGDTPYGRFRFINGPEADGKQLKVMAEDGERVGFGSLYFAEPGSGCASCPDDKAEAKPQDLDTPKWGGIGPGTWFHHVAGAFGFQWCAKCKRRANELNRAGWRGAPRVVIGWIAAWMRRKGLIDSTDTASS